MDAIKSMYDILVIIVKRVLECGIANAREKREYYLSDLDMIRYRVIYKNAGKTETLLHVSGVEKEQKVKKMFTTW